jgi:hypothetical protein
MKTDPVFTPRLEDTAEVAIRPQSLPVSPLEDGSPAGGVSWLHRLAALAAVLEFLVVALDALAGSNRAQYLALDRSMTEFAAALTTLLAVLLLMGRSARSVKTLGLIAALVAIPQALAPAAVRHDPSLARLLTLAPLSLLLFGVVVSLALFTRTDWRWDLPKVPDVAAPSFRHLSVFTTSVLLAVTVLGSIYTRGSMRLAPHLIGGVLLAIGALWMLEIALNMFSQLRQLKIGAVILAELVVIELLLGLVSYRAELDSRAFAHPLPGLAVMRTTHAAIGALTLAAGLFTVFQSFKYLAPRAGKL